MPRPHYWWKVSDIAGLVDELQNAGPDAVLRFYEDTERLHVDDPDAATTQSHDGDEGYNFVHRCPPDCP